MFDGRAAAARVINRMTQENAVAAAAATVTTITASIY